MEKRAYGDTGERLSIIGFGGIVVSQTEPEEAERLVAEAVDRGVNYFDVAPTYGNAEERLGPALEPYRKEVFLACKTTQRTAQGAEEELQNSLEMMRTDHFDLYQMHAVNTPEDFAQVTSPGGALETFVAAREKGLVRYQGEMFLWAGIRPVVRSSPGRGSAKNFRSTNRGFPVHPWRFRGEVSGRAGFSKVDISTIQHIHRSL